MKWVLMIFLGVFLSLVSLSVGHSEDQILRRNEFLQQWELQENGQTKLYFRKNPWWSNRWKVKDGKTHETVGEIRWNPFLKEYQYRSKE